jgi:hypothetical protein
MHVFKNSAPISKKTHVSITKVNWLMLFTEIIAIYSENHTKPINTFCGQNAKLLNVKAGDAHTVTTEL